MTHFFFYLEESSNRNLNEWGIFQARALKLALEIKDLYTNVYVGMRYWHPFTEDALNQVCNCNLQAEKCLVFLMKCLQAKVSTSKY